MTESKNEVSERHRKEWQTFREKFVEPLYESLDGALAKEVKALADILKVYQEGERKAYGFSDGEADNGLEVSWEE